MKKLKILFLVGGFIIVLFVLGGISFSGSKSHQIFKAAMDHFHIKVHAAGRLQSAASIYIGCPSIHRVWNYTISFMAPEGKPVKKNDLILSFDAKELFEKLTLKQSELETAKKELEKIQLVEQEVKDQLILQLEENKLKKEKAQRKTQYSPQLTALHQMKKLKMEFEVASLNEKLYISKVENQTRKIKTLIHTQEAKIKNLENKVNELQNSIASMNIKAPKDGIVVYATDWDGEKKAVGDRCWMGSNILELPDLDQMQVEAVIPEHEVKKVKKDMDVEIRLDSNTEKIFRGKIKSLGRIFHTKSRNQPSIVIDTIITILNPDPQLMRPGMAANVDIIISSKPNTLQIPESAIIYDKKGLSVLKKKWFGNQLVSVTIGARSNGMVEVLSGLKENDQIIIQTKENGEK